MVDLGPVEGRIAVKDGQLIIEGLVFDYMPKIEADLTLVFRGNIVRNTYETIQISLPRANSLILDNVFGTVEVKRPSRWRLLKRALGIPMLIGVFFLIWATVFYAMYLGIRWVCTGRDGEPDFETWTDWTFDGYWANFHEWVNR